ncbi:MAG: hypothetical protein ABWJ42_01425 [Sulfolobales archaeon]
MKAKLRELQLILRHATSESYGKMWPGALERVVSRLYIGLKIVVEVCY